VVICLAILTVGLSSANVSAGVGNWALCVRAYDSSWGHSGAWSDIGLQPAPIQSNAPNTPANNKVSAVVVEGAQYFEQRRLDSDITYPTLYTPVIWNLRIGYSGNHPPGSINIAVYNQALDSSGGDQAFDTHLVYILRNGSDIVASFASPVYADGLTNWVDISNIMHGKGWDPKSNNTGWYYSDNSPALGDAWSDLEVYSMEVGLVAQPSALFVFGAGLTATGAFAIRRLKAARHA